MTNQKNTSGWRIAAALIAVAGVVGSVHAQQGRRGGGGGGGGGNPQQRTVAPAPQRQQQASRPQGDRPRENRPQQQQPAPQPRVRDNEPAAPAPAPQPRATSPRPAAPSPQPAPTPAPAPAQRNPARSVSPAPTPPAPPATAPAPAKSAPRPEAPKADRPAPEPKSEQPRPTAPKPVVSKPAAPANNAPKAEPPNSRPAVPPPAVQKPGATRTDKPAPERPIVAKPPAGRPRVEKPAADDPVVSKPKPGATPPAVVVKRPTAAKPTRPGAEPKALPPANNLNKPGNQNKPAPIDRDPTPPVVKRPTLPGADPAKPLQDTRPARMVNRDGTGGIKAGNGLVKSITPTDRAQDPLSVTPRPVGQPRSAGGSTQRRGDGLVRANVPVNPPPPVNFSNDLTYDSGFVRQNNLVRELRHDGDRYNGGPNYVVNGYSHHGYPWRNRSYVSFSSGYCAPSPCYPRWPYYSSPFYGSSLYSATFVYSSDPWCSTRYYVPCPPVYTYCAPTYYTYCPPVYCAPTYIAPTYCGPTYYNDSWSLSIGIGSCSSWLGFSYGSSYCSPYSTYRPYGYCDPCGPRSYWWRRPVWGWSSYSCEPWSRAEPRGPVYPFPTYETTGAIGLTQAASLDASSEFEDAVYSTMRGNYQTAIQTTREAVLAAPESFAPGQSELDKYQLQRATWALTVYENPPRATVDDKDAAFMVAALAALSGDHDRAREAATEARDLGDDHPATLQLLEKLAMDEARADWGVQAAMK